MNSGELTSDAAREYPADNVGQQDIGARISGTTICGHESDFRFRRAGEVGIFDVDARLGQPLGDCSEGTRFVVALDHQNIVLES